MKLDGLVGITRRKKRRTTRRDPGARPAPDLVQRKFVADRRDQLWVADMSYVPAGAGFLYLAVVIDAWSRRVVGWSMETHLRTELVLQALNMAISQRRPKDVIHHSDQGNSIHVHRLRTPLQARRRPPLHGERRRCIRQRHV
jgi:putative transposase